MSSRALRKKLQESGSSQAKKEPAKKEAPTAVEASTDSEEEEAEETPVVKFKNPFDLLGGGGGADEDDEDEESEEEPPKPVVAKVTSPPAAKPKQGGNIKNSKGGNLKKSQQQQGRKGAEPEAEEDPEEVARRKKEEDEKFDQLLKEFGAKDRQNVASIGETETKTQQILEIDSKYLDPTVEIKQMFGSKVLNQRVGEPGGAAAGRQAQQQQRRAILRSRRLALKKTSLVKPRENWPPLGDDGLDMELVESKTGVNYFKFNWGPAYKEAQKHFFTCVQTGDPNTLAMLLRKYPYHADSLLQLYEALKIMGDLDAADDLLERLLYRFETAWHSRFDPLKQANNRLPYHYFENRSWYLGLFTRIELLGRRGCIKTALESCKLLLSFDLSDPLGMLLLVDHFALRTKLYEWIFRAYSSPMFEEKGISTMPNWCFSAALSKFYLENKSASASSSASSSSAGSASSSATEMLEHAIIMFPSMIIPLLDKISVKTLPNAAHTHKFLTSASSSAPLAVKLLVALYVERNAQFWKEETALAWIKQTIQATLRRVDESDPMVANCAAIVHDTYEELPSNVRRHILLSDFSNVVNMLPANIVRDGFQIYDDPSLVEQQQQQQQGAQQQQGWMANPLAQFLVSLLPWAGQQGPNAANPLDQQALAELFGAVGGAGEEFDDDEEFDQ